MAGRRQVETETAARAAKISASPSTAIRTVGHEELAEDTAAPAGDGSELFNGQVELSLTGLVEEVRRRNPSLQAALSAYGAAIERCPQVSALEDPMLQTMAAPSSFWPDNQKSYVLGVGQKIPWGDKRELRGQAAQWNAVAASYDHADLQLRLAEAAQLAFFDYYLVFRQRELNDANLQAVGAFHDTAKSKFESNQVTQQDVLQAEVELARIEQRRVELDQSHEVAVARINLLLHREPQHPLPPPPRQLGAPAGRPDVGELRRAAIEQRPDLAAIAARLQSEQSALALANQEYYPDFEVMGKYDTFWTDAAQRAQIALNLNVPIYQEKRHAAVREAMFRVNRLQAEYEREVDVVKNEVQTAHARLEASRRTRELFEGKLLPATEGNVAAAASGYTAGTVDFLRLVQAQREFIELNEKYQQALVEQHRNRAELDRVVGTPK
ncbi:MAG: TolC family protein [Planctomycetia bacterium]|nr:TolC family protein [Planctomycetia bacterium]